MGGLSLGFALALGAKIKGIDINRWAVETYNLNLARFGCRATVGDVLKWEPVGEFDLVIGGSPCQPFSVANTKRRGEDHPLFPTFSRFYDIVLALRPKAFLMENVKGLVTKTFIHYLTQQISRVHDYRVKYAVLNAADYGVPQKRGRLFVVGIRKDLNVDFEFPKPTHAREEWITLREAIWDIMHIPPMEGKKMSEKQKARFRKRWEERNFDRKILFMDASGEIIEIPWIPYQDAYPPLDLDEPSRTITSHLAKFSRDALLPIGDNITEIYRRLTVRECLRIQSFPDWWRFPDGCSVSSRYKLVGEAVPPILAYRIAVAIGKALSLEVRNVTKDEFLLPYFNRVFG
jgi:DNA (cytosine-5)-methyltransferase 1